MKNYEEMTQSVLSRAKAQRAAQKRRSRNMIAAATCVCCLTLAVAALTQLRKPEPSNPSMETATTAPTDPIPTLCDTPRISFLTGSLDNPDRQKLLQDIVAPFNLKLWVVRTKGLTDSEIDQELARIREYWRQSKSYSGGLMMQYGHKNAHYIVTYDGKFYLVLDDFSQVESISVSTTESGEASHSKVVPTIDGWPVWKAEKIYWHISKVTRGKLSSNPDMKLSEIQDTLTVAVKFKDGTTETATIDITFDDDGNAFVMQRGITITA